VLSVLIIKVNTQAGFMLFFGIIVGDVDLFRRIATFPRELLVLPPPNSSISIAAPFESCF